MSNKDKYHLRLFLTPNCNFRCLYCNNRGVYKQGKIIDTCTVKKVLKEAISLGIKRVHYTGGEPTLRQDLHALVKYATSLGYEEQVITTNGFTFHKIAERLKSAGLTRVTISLDTLDRKKFNMITSVDGLNNVLRSIDETMRLWDKLKINTVLMKINLDEVEDFISLSEQFNGRLICRFIEINPNNPAFFWNEEKLEGQRVDRKAFFDYINSKCGCIREAERTGENPNSEYYAFEKTRIIFGVITNPSLGYPCGDCHKIRVSPYGEIGYCIGLDKIKIKGLDDIRDALEWAINKRESMTGKNRKHFSSHYGHWRFGDMSTEDRTIYIIKPDAYAMKNDILMDIRKAGFDILSKTDVQLNPETVRKFYDQEDETLISFLEGYVGGGMVQAGILKKKNAILNFIELTGWMADPRKCDKDSLRYRYSNTPPLVRGDRIFFYNAIHKTVQNNLEKEMEIYWNEIKHPDIIKAVKQLVIKKADSIERITYHIAPVVRNGVILADRYGASRPIVEIACYIHDITRMTGDEKNHHISGAKVAEEFLSRFNYPEERIDLIKRCILNHRGNIKKERKTAEERIVATADAMAHIQYPLPLFFTFFGKRHLGIEVGRKQIIEKLERSWAKIYYPEVKNELRERFEFIIQILRYENG